MRDNDWIKGWAFILVTIILLLVFGPAKIWGFIIWICYGIFKIIFSIFRCLLGVLF